MRAVILSLFAAGLSIAAVSTPAAARDYAYCVQGRQTGYPGDCSYSTFEQCQMSASGRDAYCGVNPRVAFQQQRLQGQGGPREPGYAPRVRGAYGSWDGRY